MKNILLGIVIALVLVGIGWYAGSRTQNSGNIAVNNVSPTSTGTSTAQNATTSSGGSGSNQNTGAPTGNGTTSSGGSTSGNGTTSGSGTSHSGGSTVTPGNPCTGTPLGGSPVNVTAQMSQVGTGVTVTQITTTKSNWTTYSDMPTYSAAAHVLAFNTYGTTNSLSTANLDGTGAQIISGNQQGRDVAVSEDGKYAYYEGQNPNQSSDMYAVALTGAGACQPVRLSNLNLKPIPPEGSLIISNSSIDPATGRNVIAFSEGLVIHRVLDNGTELPDVTLGDPENMDVLHRMRLNPKFPNIMWYKRDQAGQNPNGVAQEEIWVVDLNHPGTVYSVAGPGVAADHNTWSPDGTEIGYQVNGQWYAAKILNPDGTWALQNGGFAGGFIGPKVTYTYGASYCTFAPDGSVYVCTTGGAVHGIPVYLMSLDGTKVKLLADTDAKAASFDGIPKAEFLDMQHVVFSSDRTGTPQVYVISGFTTTFP